MYEPILSLFAQDEILHGNIFLSTIQYVSFLQDIIIQGAQLNIEAFFRAFKGHKIIV